MGINMKHTKKLIILLLCILLCMSSCGNSTNENTNGTTDTSSDTQTDTPSSLWLPSEGVEITDNVIKNTDHQNPHNVISAGELGENFILFANVSINSKGYTKLFIESEFDENGEIKNGICATIDARTGVFTIHLYNRYDAKKQSSCKFDANNQTDYSVKIIRNGSDLDSYLYSASDDINPLSYSSISLKKLKGSQNAICMLGDVTITNYTVSEVMEDNSKKYQNPILSINKDLGDPTVYYEDGKYYMLTTGRMNCYVSEDLVNFKDVGVVADTSKLYGHTYFGGGSIFKYEGTYYLFYTSYIQGEQKCIMCVATSDKVTGPYTQTKQTTVDEEACPVSSAGAFPFVAEDGKTYLYWYETLPAYGNTVFGAEATFKDGVVTVHKDTKKQLLHPTEDWERKSENGASGRVTERPNVYYHNGYYYLFYAGSHWKTSYGQGYAVSKEPLGEYTKYKNNPILDSTASLHGVGCTYIVPSPDGSELFVVYHAHQSAAKLQRNVCIDRIIFQDNGDDADIAKIIGPTSTPQVYPK